jgi:hypothetical protein
MPKLPRLSGEQAIYVLEQLGFSRVRQRGSPADNRPRPGGLGHAGMAGTSIAIPAEDGNRRAKLNPAQHGPEPMLKGSPFDHLFGTLGGQR